MLLLQPRRISALGLAGRVAQERGEEVGNTVGNLGVGGRLGYRVNG